MQLSNHRKIGIWALLIVLILSIPYIAKAPWTGSDYLFAGIVLFALAFIFEYVTRNTTNIYYKVLVGWGLMVCIALLIGWAASGP